MSITTRRRQRTLSDWQASMNQKSKGPTIRELRMKALRDMIDLLKQALAELNNSCGNAVGSPLAA